MFNDANYFIFSLFFYTSHCPYKDNTFDLYYLDHLTEGLSFIFSQSNLSCKTASIKWNQTLEGSFFGREGQDFTNEVDPPCEGAIGESKGEKLSKQNY